MGTIFNIQTEYKSIIKALIDNGGELNDELQTAIEITQKELYRKTESYSYAIKEIDGEISIIKEEIERLQCLINSRDKAIKRMKDVILKAMETFEIDKIETPMIKISVRESEAVEVINEAQIPDIYFAEKTTKTLSKTMIKEAIKSGASIDGAIIKINKSLQIK
jgi:hypothetical protein